MALSMTRREQLKGLLDALVQATYTRIGAKKRAEEELKKSQAWIRREKVRLEADKVIRKANRTLGAVEEELRKIVSILGPIKSENDDEEEGDAEIAGLSEEVAVVVTPVPNPVSSFKISEKDGEMILHGNKEGYSRGQYIPSHVFAKAKIGSDELHSLVEMLNAEFTAALTEKDILAVLTRAKADLGAIKK